MGEHNSNSVPQNCWHNLYLTEIMLAINIKSYVSPLIGFKFNFIKQNKSKLILLYI
jgi:hypothetical protein